MNTRLGLVASIVIAAAGSLLTSAAQAQFVPDNKKSDTPPASTPATQPAQQQPTPDGDVQTPGGKPGDQEFPGPAGTKIRFPTTLYDETAVATDQIRKAREQAKLENKRVLVMWGENRCGFCVFLDHMLKHDAQIAPVVKGEYVWIKIDIGKFDKNIDIAGVYNTPLLEQGFGAPALTVIDPITDAAVDRRGGNSIVRQPMLINQPFDTAKVFEFLNANRPPAKVAVSAFNNALAEAKSAGTKVLVYFVVPASEDCEKLDEWAKAAQRDTELTKGMQIVKIDTQRMIGGSRLLKKVAETDAAAAPFICVVDSEGKSVGPEAMLTSLPTRDGEIKQFEDILKTHAPKLSDTQRAAVIESLKKAAQPASPPPKSGEPAKDTGAAGSGSKH